MSVMSHRRRGRLWAQAEDQTRPNVLHRGTAANPSRKLPRRQQSGRTRLRTHRSANWSVQARHSGKPAF